MSVPAHLDFSVNLHRQLAPSTERSFCWSPYSVFSALGLTAEATAGATHAELCTALRGDLAEQRRLASAAAELADDGGGGQRPELGVANTLWADRELDIADTYLHGLQQWPGGTARTAPFHTDPERARHDINHDVSDTTRGLIPELLRPGTVDPQTVAALVNALYLKVAWKQSFDESDTAQRSFHTPGGARRVPTMRATRELRYAAASGWQAVALPALGGVEAVILVPDAGPAPAEALDAAEPEMDARRLDGLLARMRQQRIDLSVPRFEVDGEAELRGPLGALGVRTVFTPTADFTPLTDQQLHVSTLVHQAVLRVDENGLEGAAATAAMIRMTAVMTPPAAVRVAVDRPFWFLVRHRDTGVVYFLARVTDPAA